MKIAKRVICALMASFLLITNNVPTHAAEQEIIELESTIISTVCDEAYFNEQVRSTTFSTASVDFSFRTEGLHITIDTGTTMTASVIGVKDIKIQKKGLFGIWSTVATSTGGEAYNTSYISVSLTYTGAEVGENYRVKCTHYADVDEYRELDHETESVTFNY